MAKKYVPSGYQIIDLGTLEENDILTSGEGLILKNLCNEWFSGVKKPLLITLYDATSGINITSFPSIVINSSDGALRISLLTIVDTDNSVIREHQLSYDGNNLVYVYQEISVGE